MFIINLSWISSVSFPKANKQFINKTQRSLLRYTGVAWAAKCWWGFRVVLKLYLQQNKQKRNTDISLWSHMHSHKHTQTHMQARTLLTSIFVSNSLPSNIKVITEAWNEIPLSSSTPNYRYKLLPVTSSPQDRSHQSLWLTRLAFLLLIHFLKTYCQGQTHQQCRRLRAFAFAVQTWKLELGSPNPCKKLARHNSHWWSRYTEDKDKGSLGQDG